MWTVDQHATTLTYTKKQPHRKAIERKKKCQNFLAPTKHNDKRTAQRTTTLHTHATNTKSVVVITHNTWSVCVEALLGVMEQTRRARWVDKNKFNVTHTALHHFWRCQRVVNHRSHTTPTQTTVWQSSNEWKMVVCHETNTRKISKIQKKKKNLRRQTKKPI